MWEGPYGGVLCSRTAVFLSARRKDLSPPILDTDSGELIAIDHPEGGRFTTFCQRNSDDAFAHIFWSLLWHYGRPRDGLQLEKRKSFVDDYCGMLIATDIGVIRDHVSRIYRH